MDHQKKPSYRLKLITNGLTVIFLISFQACNNDYCSCVAPPISSTLMGEWEWIKTVTPSRTITPLQSGYAKSVKFLNDGSVNYITFHQADSLTLTLVQNRNVVSEDKEAKTVTMDFGLDGVIKFNLSGDQVEFGDLMKVYSAKSDTVRHHYKRKVH